MPSIEVEKNISIFYEELGEGDRYVICSQVSHGKYSLERELAKRGFHVFLLTNRGFGRSTHITDDYGDHWYDIFAKDVIAFADKMGIEKFVYSGASHGAGTGWHVALAHPERLICFFAVVPGPHNIDEGKVSLRTLAMQGKETQPHCFRYPTKDPRIQERWEKEDKAQAALREEKDYAEIYESPATKAIDYGRPLRALETEANVQKALKTIKIPVLILGGMEDTISRPDLMLRSAKCLENCKLVIYSGFGHDLSVWEDAADDAVRFYENLLETGYYYSPIENDPV